MQRFRRSTVNCLQRLPQLSIGNCQVDSAAVPVNCFGFIEAGHDVAAPPPLLLLLLLLLMLMLVLFVQLAIYYKQIYVHSWLYIQSVDRLFVCLLNSCNLRFQLAAWQTSFFWSETSRMIQRRLRCGLPQMEDVLKILQEQQHCYATICSYMVIWYSHIYNC